tara:strand:- start:77 stop:898 length:822 start_codon:yes stop_codon:yes gene_type:complete
MNSENEKEYPLEVKSDEAETICRDCAFAVYDEETQTGCSIGKLDKFEEQGAEIIEVYDETNKEFYVVKGRVCVSWRGSDWQNKHEERSDWAKIVAKETMIRMDAHLYMDKDTTLADVDKTIESLKNNTAKPAQLSLINNRSKIDRPTLARMCTSSGLKWRVENIQEEDASRLRCIDIAVRKVNANHFNYYCIFDAGKKVPTNFISDINSSLNDDLNRFLALRSEDGNGDVGQILMHKRIGGNRDKPFLDKIEHTTRSQGCPNLLQETSKIVSE